MSALIPALIKLLINGVGGRGGGGGRGYGKSQKPQMSESQKNWYYLNRAAVQDRIKLDQPPKGPTDPTAAAINSLNSFDPEKELAGEEEGAGK